MTERGAQAVRLDMRRILHVLGRVLDRMTVPTQLGRIVMPGPTYLGMWARDTGLVALGLNRLGRTELAGELLRRYWTYQIDEETDPSTFIFRNKRFASWSEADAFQPTRQQLLAECGAFPTSVYIRTPDFPAGTCEIYTNRADPDGAAWMIIALADYFAFTQDRETISQLAPRVQQAIGYLETRDEDGDHLIEQGPNEDWADTLLRRGKVSYTEAVWYKSLDSAADIFEGLGDSGMAAKYKDKGRKVKDAINSQLLDRFGYYLDYRADDVISQRRALDTSLLVAFGVAEGDVARGVMRYLDTLGGPFGASVAEPGYAPVDIGPTHYPPGQYHNEGVWPWVSSYFALAQATIGNQDGAYDTICSLFRSNLDTIFEWVDNLTGQQHHPDFATAAGALAWAITEGSLAHWGPGEAEEGVHVA